MKKIVIAPLFVLVATLAIAQAKAAEKSTAKPISEVSKYKLIVAYQRYILANVQAQQVQEAQKKAQADLQDLVKSVDKAEGLPEGTQFQIDTNTDTVTPVLPAPEKKEAVAPKKPVKK